MKRRKDNNNPLIKNQQPKIDNADNNNNNRTLIIGLSICGKIYLRKKFLHQKQEPFFTITKTPNQYLNIRGQTSNEIQTF